MNELVFRAVLAVGAYVGWKILLAALKGLASAGETIASSWPAFFEKVWVSVFSGVAAGLIVVLVFGGDVKWASSTGLGIAGAKFVYDIFNA
jgi:hypothetical protein